MYKELGTTNFCVTTQDTPVTIRTRQLHQNYVTTLSKIYRDRIEEKPQRIGRDRKLHVATEGSDKD